MAWMSEEQAATALGVSFRTIRRRVGNGALRSMRQGSDLLVDVEVACKPDPRPGGGRQAADQPEAVPAILPIDLASTVLDSEPASKSERPDPDLRPPLAPRKFVPTAFAVPRGSQSIHPAHAMPLASVSAKSAGDVRGRSRLGVSGGGSRGTGRWTALAIWSVLTVALCGATAGARLIQQSRIRIGDVESKLSRALAAAQQSEADHARQLQTQASVANTRETKLQSDVSSARADADRLALRLGAEERDTSALRAELAEANARITSLDSQQEDLFRKLVLARANVALLKGKATVVDSLWELACRIEQTWTATRMAAPVTPAAAMSAKPRIEESQFRRLPPAPPTLGEEDLAIGLRKIVQE